MAKITKKRVPVPKPDDIEMEKPGPKRPGSEHLSNQERQKRERERNNNNKKVLEGIEFLVRTGAVDIIEEHELTRVEILSCLRALADWARTGDRQVSRKHTRWLFKAIKVDAVDMF